MSQSNESFGDYDAFIEKFKPKKTTDDCITPPEIYAVVLEYVRERWGIEADDVVRPFWPGGDYERFEYPEGCCVVDNPPFSILSKIQEFYLRRGIRFFLFAPSLTCLGGRRVVMKVDHIVCDCNITYANGVVVRTGFVTNLDEEHVLEADPALGDRLNEANRARLKEQKRQVGNYVYPDNVLTAARAQWFAAHHTPFRLKRVDAEPIGALDEQRERGKGIFGGGFCFRAAQRLNAQRLNDGIFPEGKSPSFSAWTGRFPNDASEILPPMRQGASAERLAEDGLLQRHVPQDGQQEAQARRARGRNTFAIQGNRGSEAEAARGRRSGAAHRRA